MAACSLLQSCLMPNLADFSSKTGRSDEDAYTAPAAKRSRLFKLGLTAIFLLFVGELLLSLLAWHRISRNGLPLAAFASFMALGFFWTSLLLIAERFSRLVAWLEYKVSWVTGVIGRIVAALLVTLVWNLVVASLTVRFALDTFLNLSLLRFAYTNMSHGLFEHMMGSQRWMLIALLAFLALSSGWIFWKSFRSATCLNLLGDATKRRPFLYSWLALFTGFTLALVLLNQNESKAFKTRMFNHLSFKLDPLLNFSLNCYDFYRQSKYESMVLDAGTLVPLSTPFSQPAAGMQDKPNIIFLQIESFRGDLIGQTYQGIEIVPNLNRLAHQGTWFTKGYAPATHTSLSNPSIPSSLYPLRKDLLVAYKASDPWPKKLIWDVLKPYGYSTAYIASEFESWCGMDDFLITPSLDVMIDSTSRKREEVQLHPEIVKGPLVHVKLVPDQLTVGSAIQWMDDRIKEKKPFYTTISLCDSHFPYKSSVKDASWFKPAGVPEECTFNNYPRELTEQIRNSYFNSIHGVDMLIGQIFEFLQQRGVYDHTIIVVYGDHGESFYENGFPSHANLPYDPSARTCLIMSGKNYFDARIEPYPASLIDVAPTILGRLGLKSHPNFQGIDVLSTNRPPLESRCLYLHVDGLVNADGLLAAGRWKYFEDNGKGDAYLYDLDHDPGETANLVESQPAIAELLSSQLSVWRTAQLTYYRSARYYTQFYPPTPQMIKIQGSK
jgi:phosphoglycerol transferase MdoB-like AlkP superfamily enzyme